MTELTRNESAVVVELTFSGLVRDAPETTKDVRETGGEAYLVDGCLERAVDAGDLHEHHRVWAEAGLNDAEALDLAEKLRARLKVVGDAALVARGLEAVPWYD